ncbi:uncharacterized protein LOC135482958 [Lineus longissimus]|uniref:uncharacterized protein LOC135482958 n=1 Tax=Lineus longissimus TaxID=88925 RepID=UPI00315CC0FF
MQGFWALEVDWDERLPSSVQQEWREWIDGLSRLCELKIPRCYQLSFSEEPNLEISLHNFSDASEKGYGMCAYLRFAYSDGTVHCSFLAGRARCAPAKTTLIPRLELQAAVLSANISSCLQEELTYKLSAVTYWSDSQTTLQYIKNDSKRFHVYVANRVAAVRDITEPEQWKHCPGVLNPADIASRGMSAGDLIEQDTWWNGPNFLKQSEEFWPKAQVQPLSNKDAEVKGTVKVNIVKSVKTSTDCYKPKKITTAGLQEVIKRCGTWVKLTRSVAWVVRFCQGLKNRKFPTSNLTAEELNATTLLIAQDVQSECYKEDIDCWRKRGHVKASSPLACLKPMLIEGVFRVGGRLDKAPSLSFEEKHPMIMPADHHVSVLIARDCHKRLGHTGREHIFAETRKRFWIIGGRRLAKRIVRGCIRMHPM